MEHGAWARWAAIPPPATPQLSLQFGFVRVSVALVGLELTVSQTVLKPTVRILPLLLPSGYWGGHYVTMPGLLAQPGGWLPLFKGNNLRR